MIEIVSSKKQMRDFMCKNKYEDLNKSVTEQVNNDLENLLDLDSSKKKEKLTDIKKMIGYYSSITSDIEARRIKLIETTWQNILIILGVLTITYSTNFPLIIKFYLTFVMGLYLFPQILKVIEYYGQSRFRYPFLQLADLGNQWKWFYHGNKYIKEIGDNPHINKPERDIKKYLKGLSFFIQEYTNENEDSELRNSILQLYLLQVHNGYKNRWYLRLLRINKRWSIFALIIVTISFLVLLLLRIFYPQIFGNILTVSL